MKKIRIKKRVWIIAIVVVFVFYKLYNLVFVSDIPITKPNVNHKDARALELVEDTLHDQFDNPLIVIERGRLVVNEDRTDDLSNRIEIYFERMKRQSNTSYAPILFLAGGPGSSATAIGRTEYFYLFRELSKYTDVILLDQRGTGNSIPNLSCRNALDSPTDITANAQVLILDDLVKKCMECANELSDMGIKLNAYNSYESVLDIEDLRQALGYDKISLYGYSYGTELAQLYIKYFEDHVDRTIMAGPMAPDHGLKLPLEVQEQFEKMDSLIKLDPKLSKYIPDFLELVRQTHNDLRTNPKFVQIPFQDAFDQDETSERIIGDLIAKIQPTWDMTLTDDHFQMMVSDNIGKDSWIRRFPSFYYDISKDSLRDIGNMLRNFRRRRMPNALFFTANAATGYTNERWKPQRRKRKLQYSHISEYLMEDTLKYTRPLA